ncbi:LOW QUALITY PROTEIN: uncharacterized protein LOC110224211 [Arabidopsis lyrata subsp. lyrata]|uniref:LOW QUALITY PROTEIN: uncharacterized protein LOC110224211 n=1 Tax=Arabidopsis lyrata subsp. lyrata TaxID=81972 RepID=UPI000A29C460|nr:LOW QUALITY PROTEIN: uncharacterized protein LOC110224211 [Arabidopsis lyrata subsp. lyrata]|eukprot:XP_020865727.1 LOW QUALITY PROTEIN: uncharacterized protein LOC110224211 [Arabidopsis lyrata subsp. lyrata]
MVEKIWRICSSSSLHVATIFSGGSTGSLQSVSSAGSTGRVKSSTSTSVKSSTSSLCITSQLQAQNSHAEEDDDEEAEFGLIMKGNQLSRKIRLLLSMSCFSSQAVRSIQRSSLPHLSLKHYGKLSILGRVAKLWVICV